MSFLLDANCLSTHLRLPSGFAHRFIQIGECHAAG
jgi:hypothetical protein